VLEFYQEKTEQAVTLLDISMKDLHDARELPESIPVLANEYSYVPPFSN
jgi:hypothetical protein